MRSDRMKFTALAIAAMLLVGCENMSSVNVTGKAPVCVSQCRADSADCMSGPTMAPIDRNNLCVRALRSCVNACPAEGVAPVTRPAAQQPDNYTDLKRLKELLDSQIITPQEFETQKAKILAR